MGKKLIQLENITKTYDGNMILDDLNLYVKENEFLTLLGPSGCGKTTTLRLIGGFETPDTGRIIFDGKDITSLPPNERKLNTVFQKYALFTHMSIADNIAFGLKISKKSKAYIQDKIKYALKLVNLDGYENRSIDSLSGGQQQRIAIARAIVNEPKVLLLDEPLGALDLKMRQDMQYELIRLKNELGITFIYVTHDQEEAMSISDMIVVMKSGVVQQIGKPQDVYDSPVNLFVARFLGTPPINVFEGEIRGQKLYIGENAILDAPGISDQQVFAGIRPEGFVLDKNGPLCCQLGGVEVMGRDISVVSSHAASQAPAIRSIISSESSIDLSSKTIRFAVKPNKIFLFGRETEERIYL